MSADEPEWAGDGRQRAASGGPDSLPMSPGRESFATPTSEPRESLSSPLTSPSHPAGHMSTLRHSTSSEPSSRAAAFPLAGQGGTRRSPLLHPHRMSADGPPPPPRPSPQNDPPAHTRSISVPAAAEFPPERGRGRSSPREKGSGKKGHQGQPLVRARSSAESEFFKPFLDNGRKPHQSSSFPVGAGEAALVGKSGGQDGAGSGEGTPREPPPTPETGAAGRRADEAGEQEPNTRVIYIDDPGATAERSPGMANNRVRTSKYTLYSFLPKNLFEQFHRYAYIYFLIIVILNQIPALAVFGRTASLFPLVFVLVVTAVKDAYEDWGRHKSDRVENNRTSLVLSTHGQEEGSAHAAGQGSGRGPGQGGHGQYVPKKWKHMLVGEMIKIRANEGFPCDMVLLSTSDPSGLAYVETMNLDGESSLKSRYALQETAAERPELGGGGQPVAGTLICELPNRNIYEFTAYMDLGGMHLPLGPKNIVLRGCELKNTAWVVGVAVYAGQDTKALLNSAGAQSKRSQLEHQMNRATLWLGLFLLVLCLVGGIGMLQWVARHSDDLNRIQYYHKKEEDDEDKNYRYYGIVGEGLIGFLSCIIVFQIMIPISLYISVELVRLGQAWFMSHDQDLYHEASDTRFQCRALNINEDVGQIKYVFADKTGTLTENCMEFYSASINGVDYSDAKIPADMHVKVDGAFPEAPPEGKGKPPKAEAGKVDSNLARVLQHPDHSEQRRAVHEYLLVLAMCNTVVPTRVEAETDAQAGEGGGEIEYQGESPDEQALVAAAASYGYTLLERTSTHLTVDILGDSQRFQVLGMHEFDSIRKRMSVVVRCPDGTIKLLMKGADSAVLNILEPESQESEVQRRRGELARATVGHLDQYAREGLRTLVVATRNLDPGELQAWEAQCRKANMAVTERGAMQLEAAAIIERNMLLVGASGVEDKLQEGVPETIALLREANMQVWVLTGDKQETAISVAFSCLLITPEMEQIVVNETTRDGCREALAGARSRYGIEPSSRGMTRRRQKKTIDTVSGEASPAGADHGDVPLTARLRSSLPGRPLALVIDGNSLVHCLDEDLEQELFDLAVACKVVVCCRVAPLQKAGIVSLVKRRAKEITLAVGDGANDVSMIQMAHVGIGISGQEGRQAVMASDFAMGQFRYLRKVLLVHGHWNYYRLGYMLLYNFYRNAVFVLMLFWFILYTAFSPQSALTDWNLVLYSVIYTSVPTIIVGVLDKDLSQNTLLRYPALYTSGQKGVSYNQPLFWAVMMDTVWQSLVVFYVPYMSYRRTQVGIYGLGSLWTMGVVILVNVHLAMDIQHWTWIHHAAVWLSIVATWICVIVMDSIISVTDLLPHYWVTYHMMGEWSYWFDLLLILPLALLPRFIVKVFWQRFFPSDIQVAREAEIKGNDSTEQGVEMSEIPRLLDPRSPNA